MTASTPQALQRDRRVLALAILAALAAFVIDLTTPHGVATGVFYIVPVTICLWSSKPAHLLRIAGLSTLLALAGFFVPPPDPLWIALTNRSFALLVIWTTTMLTARFRRLEIVRSEEQRQSAERMEQVLEGAPDAMVITDGEGRIQAVNTTGERLFGYAREELIGQPVEMLVPAPLRTRHRAHRQDYYRNPGTRPMRIGIPMAALRKDGTEFPMEATLSALQTGDGISVITALRDVTERKRLEEQLQQSQKLETIGRLVGGIAHDFNNILTVIISFTRFAKDALPADETVHADLDEVLKASTRATDLTRQLLAYSRSQIVEPRILNLNERIHGMDRMLRRILGEDIELTTLADPEISSIKVDPGHLDQVLVNLVVNARESMPRGGRLVIETANISLADVQLRQHERIPAGNYVMLAVSDTGEGMADEVKDRLFEPFYTTKRGRGGTGLGLSVCYGIVKQAGGYIYVYSELGKGSTFKVYFPSVGEAAEPPAPHSQPPADLRGTETILLVEDDAAVRTSTARALEEAGYTVLEAGGGEEALSCFDEHRERIALLLTDVVLPDMNGRELGGQIEERRPGTPVVFMSGYTTNVIARNGVLDPGILFVQKPFRPETLLQKIRAALGPPAPPYST